MRHLLFALFVTALLVPASQQNDKPVLVHEGFATGQDYIQMTETQRRAYAMGVVDGMLLSPLFEAPQEKVRWLEGCVRGMTDRQVAEILFQFVKEHPEGWHKPLHVLAYAAMRKACTP